MSSPDRATARSGRTPRPMPPLDPDRVPPPRAAGLVRLGYPEAFNIVRWQLEEAFNPTTGAPVPIPLELRVQLLTSSQERQLEESAREAYREAKAKRIDWAASQWMRVPVWGGRRSPAGEWRYSAERCATWYARTLGLADDITSTPGGTDAR